MLFKELIQDRECHRIYFQITFVISFYSKIKNINLGTMLLRACFYNYPIFLEKKPTRAEMYLKPVSLSNL